MTHLKHLEKALSLSQKETLLALNKIQKKFGKKPHNPQIFISQKKLFLQLAATWIPIAQEKGSDKDKKLSSLCVGPTIQIHPKLLKKKQKSLFTTLFFSYSIEEVLAHEFVHLVRYELFPYKEHLGFEEILAYQTSSSRFRRFLGPLLARPSDILWLLPLFLSPIWVAFLPSLFTLSWLGLALLLAKLSIKQWIFQRATKILKHAKVKNPLYVLIGLKDQEIWDLAIRPKYSLKKLDLFKSR